MDPPPEDSGDVNTIYIWLEKIYKHDSHIHVHQTNNILLCKTFPHLAEILKVHIIIYQDITLKLSLTGKKD